MENQNTEYQCPNEYCNGVIKRYKSKNNGKYYWFCKICKEENRYSTYTDCDGQPKFSIAFCPHPKCNSIVHKNFDNNTWYCFVCKKEGRNAIYKDKEGKPFYSENTYNVINETHYEGYEQVDFKTIYPTIISKIGNISLGKYSIQGDVYNTYSNSYYHVYEIIDEHNTNKKITVCTPKGAIPNTTFLDKRVLVCGTIRLYKETGTFQLHCTEDDIKILGECSRIQKIAQWKDNLKDKLQDYYIKYNRKFNFSNDSIKIYVLSPNQAQGLEDFKNSIENYHEIEAEYVQPGEKKPFDIPFLVEKIRSLNSINNNLDRPFDFIVIIRGGGDKEILFRYSNPDFVTAIFNSKIPCILGIGHLSDKELCNSAAKFFGGMDCGTPSYVATKLTKIINKQKYIKKEEKIKTIYNEFFNNINNEIRSLRNYVDEKSQSKKEGFFSWFFGKKGLSNEESQIFLNKINKIYRSVELFKEKISEHLKFLK